MSKLFILCCITILTIIACSKKQSPILSIIPEKEDFGNLKKDSTYTFNIYFANKSSENIYLENYTTFCNCSVLNLPKQYTFKANTIDTFAFTIKPSEVTNGTKMHSNHFRIKGYKDLIQLKVKFNCNN